MNLGDKIIAFVDRILDLFNKIKGLLTNAIHFFERLKTWILEKVESFTNHIEEYTEEDLLALQEEHYFI